MISEKRWREVVRMMVEVVREDYRERVKAAQDESQPQVVRDQRLHSQLTAGIILAKVGLVAAKVGVYYGKEGEVGQREDAGNTGPGTRGAGGSDTG